VSHQLISRSPDLKRLRDEGYDIEIRSGYLLMKGVPYVNSKPEVLRGVIVSKLTLANDVTTAPDDHVAFFAGEYPCRADGTPIEQIRNSTGDVRIDEELTVNHTFSAKPKPHDRYADYYDKMTTYAAILSGPARLIEPGVDAITHPVIAEEEGQSVFHYMDTASSRAEISLVTKKLELSKVVIVGLGGTGSYVLDFVAKTPVKEIHLFDGDVFLQHNAFRSPGAPSGAQLEQKLVKVDYLGRIYSNMHRHIIGHPAYVDASNIDELRTADFVFLCLDRGSAKRLIVDKLTEFGVPFVDVGMGIFLRDDALGGIVRTTTSTPEKRDHVIARKRIPFGDSGGNNEYDRNIQIADLNALNAAYAVIKWKKIFGFYVDLEREHHSLYTIDGNDITNEDQA
jgi:hypothetical protein